MAKKLEVCVNHAGRYTNRHCYVCHKSICKDCQKVRSHHIFCGKTCWYRFLLREFFQSFQKKFRNTRKVILSQNTLILWGTIVLLFLILMRQNLQLSHKIETLQKKTPGRFWSPVTPNEEKPKSSPLVVQKPVKGAMVLSNKITIRGIADDGAILILEQKNKPVAVTLPQNGKFVLKDIQISRASSHFKLKALSSEGKVTAIEELHFHYAPPSIRFLATPIRRGDRSQREIALTFDGGALNNITGKILDILRQKNVLCTIFLTGEFIRRYPETVRRIVREGHKIGNHTFHHPHLTTYAKNRRQATRENMTRERFQKELTQTAKLFEEVTGKKMAPYWRAPYGESNPEIRLWAAELGYREVDWTFGKDQKENMDTRDWVAHPGDAGYQTGEEIKEKILKFADEKNGGANGAIILMHLGSNRTRDFPYKKLPEIIDSLRANHYKLVTVGEIVK
ncbi:peptidoglycan-N-acetylmuramic acid deacetylase PdaA precursor [bacterium BMS3Abin05]|nr:peptidoglycan-N-acetylmuramic acid deacetylase PdaA precursor [bacterium BMS3Abin05]GBE28057.1 peptidoglycan-N-acetylmuramic acid deacetylase PdaA precursor [bacterium BMS3Bbin03]HDK35575.1 polysaccharide deacetylase family protein [Bacteroidota bacterium]HDL78289.1 polysaccharide deacetylase family protein [Bacteroidota bacterium]HDZ11009.1 polysaccharide deacetylase family protein [Bacteroidota bacterium]